MTRQELLAGLGRMGVVTAAAFAVTIGISVLFGLLGGVPLRRAVSVGLYLASAAFILLGLFQGIKPPVRKIHEHHEHHMPPSPIEGMFGSRGRGPVRWATPEERGHAGATAVFLLGLGVAMLVAGTIVDGRRAVI